MVADLFPLLVSTASPMPWVDYGSDGVWVAEHPGEASAVRMSLRAWGREGALELLSDVVPEAADCSFPCNRRMEYLHLGLVEWWDERTDGLEHGFTVASPPPGVGFLVFDIVVGGADVVLDGRDATAAAFTRPGSQHLSYTGLVAWDETGRTLPTWMEHTSDGLRLVVDDTDASGAVTVDPLLTLAWIEDSDQPEAYYGRSVSSAGDVNADGYDDVLVGAVLYDGGEVNEGRAFLYLGSASGLATTAAWTGESDQASAEFGFSVSDAGDINGDGYADVVVGSYYYDNGSTEEGRAYLYLGSASGLGTTAAWIGESDQTLALFGYSVSSAGDVNADGYADVIVGAMGYDNGSSDEGRAYVYHGSASGLEMTAGWTAESNQAFSTYGYSVHATGDVNADGYADVIVGAGSYDNESNDEGSAFVYLGSASGPEASPAWSAESDQASAYYGRAVSSAGDVNADGYDDVVVGAFLYDNDLVNEGRAYLYLGSSAGLEAAAAWTGESDQEGASFGVSVASAGDVNADGYADLIVGAFYYDNGSPDEGKAFAYVGSAAGLETTAAWTAESDETSSVFGWSVSSAGDVNGDGYADVVVGAPEYEGTDGRAYVYLGGCYESVDGDADTVGDKCDVCPGYDDLLDGDLDLVPDDCDVCPSYDNPGQEDADGDGLGDPCDLCPQDALNDSDNDGACDSDDCDAFNPAVYPGAPELCDGKDNACVGSVPANDADLDEDGFAVCAGDCDDAHAAVHPAAVEECNTIDDNCDNVVDDHCDGSMDETPAAAAAGCGCHGGGGLPGAPFALLGALAVIARRSPQLAGGFKVTTTTTSTSPRSHRAT